MKAVGRRQAAGSASLVEVALAAFAHEVRTPLTGILAVSDLLATSDLDVRERRWAETIKASADHLSALATLFVDAARSGQASLALRRDFFDLGALVRTAADSLAGRAAARGLRVVTHLPDRLPGFVIGDPVRLRAALENLIDNAVKFTDEGTVGLRLTVTRQRRDSISVAIAVSDSGIGLSLAEIRRLFRPFSQANVGIAARFGGAGLGLSSARQIARAMGGDITVEPRRGGGATFTLTATLARDSAADGTEAAAEAAAARPGLRILSVEDNPFGRVVLNTILTELGHHTEFAGDGEAALARISDGRFDAVLMDMVLPGIGGVETIRRIRATQTADDRLAIIGVSGRGDDEGAARRAGADGFLLKPVSPRALATALGEAVRRPAAAT
ncbi:MULTISPECIES: ATP-binding protein [unclassified Bradyrhizobium]|uniref:ATP-binding protein n=1 Tax=unclassified Bradyrhizobium TaxID=2631580 RepID=UPI002011D6C8|nr:MULTISPECIES: ATP-binding protein [unclassified Bradyrhizobium]